MLWLPALVLASASVSLQLDPQTPCLQLESLQKKLAAAGVRWAAPSRATIGPTRGGLLVKGQLGSRKLERVLPTEGAECAAVERIVVTLLTAWFTPSPCASGERAGVRGLPADCPTRSERPEVPEPTIPESANSGPRGTVNASGSTAPALSAPAPVALTGTTTTVTPPGATPSVTPTTARPPTVTPTTATPPTATPPTATPPTATPTTVAPTTATPTTVTSTTVTPTTTPTTATPTTATPTTATPTPTTATPTTATPTTATSTTVTTTPAAPSSPSAPLQLVDGPGTASAVPLALDAALLGGFAFGPAPPGVPTGALGLGVWFGPLGLLLDLGAQGSRRSTADNTTISAALQWATLSLRAGVKFSTIHLDGSVGFRGTRIDASALNVDVPSPTVQWAAGVGLSLGARVRLAGPLYFELRTLAGVRSVEERLFIQGVSNELRLGLFELQVLGGLAIRADLEASNRSPHEAGGAPR